MNPETRHRLRRKRRLVVAASFVLASTSCAANQPAPKTPAQLSERDVVKLRSLDPTPKPRKTTKPHVTKPARISWALTIKRGDPTPAQLRKLAWCESGRDHSAYGADGKHFGAYQFDLETWASVGGKGNPAKASLAEQSYRAILLFRQRGWQPWAASASCTGLR